MSFKENGRWETIPGQGDRKIAIASRCNQNGELVIGEQAVGFNSRLELNVMMVLTSREGFRSIREQVLFEWLDPDGNWRDHYFDAVLEFAA